MEPRLPHGHPLPDATQDRFDVTLPHVITTIKDLMHSMEPLLPNGLPSPDATQDRFLQILPHVITTIKDQMPLMEPLSLMAIRR